jgi:hypothetical protein
MLKDKIKKFQIIKMLKDKIKKNTIKKIQNKKNNN